MLLQIIISKIIIKGTREYKFANVYNVMAIDSIVRKSRNLQSAIIIQVALNVVKFLRCTVYFHNAITLYLPDHETC